ncbi:MAG: hypothetical protein PHE83_01150 [Opitutaceae bacterium]|nr:hypothetical protein [Opitutaceae bacterium]
MNARCFVLCVALLAGAGIVPLFADDAFNAIPSASVAESEKNGLFVEQLSIDTNWVIYGGRRMEFVEAWIEHRSRTENFLILFSKRVRLQGYWVCIRIKAGTSIFPPANRYTPSCPRLYYQGGRLSGVPGIWDFGDGDPVIFGWYDTPLPEYRVRIVGMPGEGYESLILLQRTGSNSGIEKTSRHSGSSSPESNSP